MGEVIRFMPKSERERARLIRAARAIYDSVFPPAGPVSEQQNKAPTSHTASGPNAHMSDGGSTIVVKTIAVWCLSRGTE
jgi:hypothetical protein